MFTNKDVELRTIYVINCIEQRNLRVSNGELLLEEEQDDKKKTLTKLPFQKILALFVVGHIRITTPLLEKCKRYNVALVVMKPSFRPVFFWADAAEANFLLRRKQHLLAPEKAFEIAKWLILGKTQNQLALLSKTRRTDVLTKAAKSGCLSSIEAISTAVSDAAALLGVEGRCAKTFFKAYFQDFDWQGRRPRTKCDILNATLDIGYTMLFNFVESFVRMFGFDLYIGVYHKLWFKRKSLICDLVEPFRCIIDAEVRKAFNRRQFSEKDFEHKDGEYQLCRARNGHYMQVFFDALIPYKSQIFTFVRDYYRCFMGGKTLSSFPTFNI